MNDAVKMTDFSIAQLVKIYNAVSPIKVSKFESHAAAARRLNALLAKRSIKFAYIADKTIPNRAAKPAPAAKPSRLEINRHLMGSSPAAAPVKPAKAAKSAPVTAGGIPTPPNFEAATHKPYRAKLAALIALVEARDVKGLEAFPINPTSSSPKALARYRDAAVAAIKAAGKGA